ncbi:hypothetical protein RHGRI_018597 [Rhododendron griersonianum]|uniref:Uncharacterized protein n=1 Tax=Rhododendron griersonianum TaxID=479676 RepID=A0AAV6K238_9ERIC|nr:hypothetical protein RHGRI_018597 [Rhododendron griersonianum]
MPLTTLRANHIKQIKQKKTLGNDTTKIVLTTIQLAAPKAIKQPNHHPMRNFVPLKSTRETSGRLGSNRKSNKCRKETARDVKGEIGNSETQNQTLRLHNAVKPKPDTLNNVTGGSHAQIIIAVRPKTGSTQQCD